MVQVLTMYLASLILRSIGIAYVAGICSWKISQCHPATCECVAVFGAMLLMPPVDYLLPASCGRAHQRLHWK
jgi:hypothetical protein